MMNIRNLGSKESLGVKFKEVTLDPRIIGGVGIIGGLDIVIIINNRGGGAGIIGGLDRVEKLV